MSSNLRSVDFKIKSSTMNKYQEFVKNRKLVAFALLDEQKQKKKIKRQERAVKKAIYIQAKKDGVVYVPPSTKVIP